ncbi:MAG TPA: ABC transporter permease [Spirochaetota bacterium]|nr:ABC transporter permease [Spirochaetota bacterium]
MNYSKPQSFPPLVHRLYSVWYRHFRVYVKNIFSNGLPPFLEPLIFLAGIGLGLNKYIENMNGIPYIEFLATGLLVVSAMFTAAFECSFGTFLRLEFDKVYDGMLAAPLSVNNLLVGEIIWAGSKGFFFSLAVFLVLIPFGIITVHISLLTPLIGFITGIMFASFSLFITSFVKDINQFNFYFTGFLSPMFFFSGIVFPVTNLPEIIRPVAEIFPLTHSVRLVRAVCFIDFRPELAADLVYIAVFTFVFAYWGIKRLKKKLIQ